VIIQDRRRIRERLRRRESIERDYGPPLKHPSRLEILLTESPGRELCIRAAECEGLEPSEWARRALQDAARRTVRAEARPAAHVSIAVAAIAAAGGSVLARRAGKTRVTGRSVA
jgi:hypothetical protein